MFLLLQPPTLWYSQQLYKLIKRVLKSILPYSNFDFQMIASDRRRRPQWGRTAKQTGEEAAVVPKKGAGGWGRTGDKRGGKR